MAWLTVLWLADDETWYKLKLLHSSLKWLYTYNAQFMQLYNEIKCALTMLSSSNIKQT